MVDSATIETGDDLQNNKMKADRIQTYINGPPSASFASPDLDTALRNDVSPFPEDARKSLAALSVGTMAAKNLLPMAGEKNGQNNMNSGADKV